VGITLHWDDDAKTLLQFVAEGSWTWDEHYEGVYDAIGQIEALDHKVCIIVLGAMKFPSGSALAPLNRVGQMLPPNIEKIYLVTTNTFVRTINNIAVKVNKKMQNQRVMTDTLGDAYAHIRRARAAREKS
jgi:hypothetical protein